VYGAIWMKNSIEVTVKLFAHYREGKFKVKKITYPPNSTVDDVVKDIGIDEEKHEVGVFMINGRHTKRDAVLKDGDTLSIFPKVGGG